MSAETWPPQLKCVICVLGLPDVRHSDREWVGKCLGQMTDSNRGEASAELKKVIADAFAAKTLWTTDWAGVQLNRYVRVLLRGLGCYSSHS